MVLVVVTIRLVAFIAWLLPRADGPSSTRSPIHRRARSPRSPLRPGGGQRSGLASPGTDRGPGVAERGVPALQLRPGARLAAALAAAVAEGPGPAPRGRVGAGERRGGAGGGPAAGLPPVGGGLVGQRGDGPLDALRVAGGGLALARGAAASPKVTRTLRRRRDAWRPCAGCGRCPRCGRARRARRSGSTGRRRRRGTAGPSRRGSGRPRGRSASTSRRRSASAAWSAERRVTFERSIGMAPMTSAETADVTRVRKK